MKEIYKHIIDCSLVFVISFLSATIALEEIVFKGVIIAFCSSLVISLIKFRDYWNTKLNPKSQTPTIFL